MPKNQLRELGSLTVQTSRNPVSYTVFRRGLSGALEVHGRNGLAAVWRGRFLRHPNTWRREALVEASIRLLDMADHDKYQQSQRHEMQVGIGEAYAGVRLFCTCGHFTRKFEIPTLDTLVAARDEHCAFYGYDPMQVEQAS